MDAGRARAARRDRPRRARRAPTRPARGRRGARRARLARDARGRARATRSTSCSTALGATNAASSALDDVRRVGARACSRAPTSRCCCRRSASWEPPGDIDAVAHARGLATARRHRRELLVVCGGIGRVRGHRAAVGRRPRRCAASIPTPACTSCTRSQASRSTARARRSTAWDARGGARPARASRTRSPGASRAMLALARHARGRSGSSSAARSRRSRPSATGSPTRSSRSRRSTRRSARPPTSRTRLTAALAKATAGRTARTVATHCQQVLAGIGFTTDHPFHRFLKRTMVLDGLFGSADEIVARPRPAAARRPPGADAHRALIEEIFMRTGTHRLTATAVVIGCAALALAACSSSSKSASPSSSSTTSTTLETLPRPSGPAADMSKELTGGNGVFIGEGTAPDLEADGYVQREYEASGDATSYKVVGALTPNGRWKFVPDGTAPYRTARRRARADRPVEVQRHRHRRVAERERRRRRQPRVGEHRPRRSCGRATSGSACPRSASASKAAPCSCKVTGIPGAEDAGKGLKTIDPARYGDLEHPGDGVLVRHLHAGRTRGCAPAPGSTGCTPQRVIAAGESQSAFALVTYYNGVQPLTHAFDGFFVHSRGAVGLPLVAAGQVRRHRRTRSAARRPSSAPTRPRRSSTSRPRPTWRASSTRTRLGSPTPRHFRLWEVAGTAHAA